MNRPLAAGVVVLVAVGGGAFAALQREPAPAATAPAQVKTVAVTRTDLADSRTLVGTVGYGTARTVKGPAGQVTWLPAAGKKVTRGRVLFRVNDRPAFLFYGRTPLFRALKTAGTVGRDVRVVADNLRALGYDIGDQPRIGTRIPPPEPSAIPATSAPMAVQPGDAVLTASLMHALRQWQAAAGLPPTGMVTPADAVVLPGAVRVNAATAQLGDDATGPLLSVTKLKKVVTVEMDAADAVKRGTKATVLPSSGSALRGEVVSVTAASQNRGEGDDQAKVIATVSARLTPAITGSVQVVFTTETKKHVLTVPVGALLALREGGYAVQVLGGALMPVETGLFANGMVEVTGVPEGAIVVTAE